MRPVAVVLLGLLLPASESGLEPPFRLESEGKPIDVVGGHAAPALADLDGDGVRDLLVGQFLGEGRNAFQAPMRLHRNAGTEKAPRLAPFRYLETGAEPWVPTG